jgi:hypothetical protein
MEASFLEVEQQFGKLLALEGDEDTISTQLRLLPPSQKILILPSFTESLPQNAEKQSFDARAFIRNVYSTFAERTETARSFLKSSTSTHPRLAFVNGGSVRARATCIAAVCDNITDGDVEEAETIYNDIVQDGVAGLLKQAEVNDEEVQTEVEDGDDKENEVDGMVEDPTTRAMQAAESLDRETAALQSDDERIDEENDQGHETYSEDCDSMGVAQSVQDVHEAPEEAPYDQSQVSTVDYGNPQFESQGDDIVRTVVTMRSRAASSVARNTFGRNYSLGTPCSNRTNYTGALPHQTQSDDDNDYDEGLISLGNDTFASLPPTPGVIYGEACVVDVQAVSPTASIREARRVKSVDGLYQGNSGFPRKSPSKARILRHTVSSINLGTKPAKSDAASNEVGNGFPPLPRMAFVRASQTTIRKPSTARSMSASTVPRLPPRVFVDRGTDAEEIPAQPTPEVPSEPVFALVEDLVIHFGDNESREVFESVIRSYKNGRYSVLSPAESSEAPESPRQVSSQGQDEMKYRSVSQTTAETGGFGYGGNQEFDPYSSDGRYPSIVARRNKLQRMDRGVPTQEPHTPSMTPPPEVNPTAEKFVSFRPVNPGDAISVQNSLRELLGAHFPAGENGYSQHYYSLAPETERLWKPVFRNDNSGSLELENRTVDQIIALGCEAGVKKDFFNQISGQVERLGAKKDGANRSAKVDIRYVFKNMVNPHSLTQFLDI